MDLVFILEELVMSLHVSPGISCGNASRRETYRKPERKSEADYSG